MQREPGMGQVGMPLKIEHFSNILSVARRKYGTCTLTNSQRETCWQLDTATASACRCSIRALHCGHGHLMESMFLHDLLTQKPLFFSHPVIQVRKPTRHVQKTHRHSHSFSCTSQRL